MAFIDRDEKGALAAPATGWRLDREAWNDTVVLPEQLEGSRGALPPGVAALMVAILEEAIACLLRRETERSSRRAEALRAERWLRSDDTSFPFAFESICHALSLDAGSLREAILREASRPGAPLRARRRHEVPRGDRRLESLAGPPRAGRSRSRKLDVR